MKNKSWYFILLLLCSMLSCSDELDFTQIDDLEITPTIESSVIFVQATEQIVNLLGIPEVLSQDFNFDAFSSQVFASRVIDGELTYIINNTTSKPFELEIDFLDEFGGVLDSENFTIEPSTINSTIVVSYGSTGKSIDIIKALSALRISALNLGDNVSVSNTTNPRISLQTSGKFTVRLK